MRLVNPLTDGHGHLVMVYSHAIVDDLEDVPTGLKGFARTGDKIHRFRVDGSWGDGAEIGTRSHGVADHPGRTSWYYNETTATWAGKGRTRQDDGTWSAEESWHQSTKSPYRADPKDQNYSFVGAFRAK